MGQDFWTIGNYIGEYQADLIFQLFVALESSAAILRDRHSKTRRGKGGASERDDELLIVNHQYDVLLGIHRLDA